MIHLCFGPPDGGKSLYAEGLLGRAKGHKLYIGTLSRTADHADRISAHQARRPKSWQLLELSGDPWADLEAVRQMCDGARSVLFDGLLLYLVRMYYMGIRIREWLRAFRELVEEWHQSAELVVLVDPPVPPLPVKAYRAAKIAHELLFRHATTITWIVDGKATVITPVEARLRDGNENDVRERKGL